MKKLLPLCLLVLGIAVAFAKDETPAELERLSQLQRLITDDYSFKSFDEAVKLIEQESGCKVDCPKEIADFERTLNQSGESVSKMNKAAPGQITLKLFLDQVCAYLNLGWEIDVKQQSITLGLPWKGNDERPLPQLLDFVLSRDFHGQIASDREWQGAFSALLNNDKNREKSWKTRMLADRGQGFMFFNGEPTRSFISDEPLLRKEITATDGKKYKLIFINHNRPIFPLIGGASYYWFTDDGVLAGAGSMTISGVATDASVEQPKPGHENEPTEFHFVVSEGGADDYLTARFVLGPDGLKLVRLVDSHGAAADDHIIGSSLLEQEAKHAP